MHTRLIAACVALIGVVTFAGGVVFERYVGTEAFIDWAGLRHKLAVHQREMNDVVLRCDGDVPARKAVLRGISRRLLNCA